MEKSPASNSLKAAIELKECLDPGANLFVNTFFDTVVRVHKSKTDLMSKEKAILFYLAEGISLYQRLLTEGQINKDDASDIRDYLQLLINT